MARHSVPIQKGISLIEFISLDGTEVQCFDVLYRWRWPNGFVCPHWGHDRACQLTTRKLRQCNRCHRETSIAPGTLFEAAKLPMTVWFQPIYLMTQVKKSVSAMKLHRNLGISYNAASRIRHKLMHEMLERDRAYRLTGWFGRDDTRLGGERSGGKRGRGAPGDTPFAAVETNEDGNAQRMKLTVVEGLRVSEVTAQTQQHLSAGTRLVSLGLACFNGVAAAACAHDKICGGQWQRRGRASRVSRSQHNSRQLAHRCWRRKRQSGRVDISKKYIILIYKRRLIYENPPVGGFFDDVLLKK